MVKLNYSNGYLFDKISYILFRSEIYRKKYRGDLLILKQLNLTPSLSF